MSEKTAHVQTAEERRARYKKSLNLPKSSFSMRANLAQNEPRSQKRWEESGLYRRVLESGEGKEPFVFHDGPPYANGSIHVGHLLNKVLKDLVVRTRNMSGRSCPYVPGWDCHGLPIEHRVMTELMESGKVEKLEGLEEGQRRMAIRRECAQYAQKYKKLQSAQMRRLLTLADYENPYMTMAPEYEARVLEVFAAMVEQGLVYRDLKPVHWSIANRTALAEAELEYFEREDPSVYVHFEARDAGRLAGVFGVEPPPSVSFLIWTTTPWTLPANLLIAVKPGFRYRLVMLGGRATVIAAELVERVSALCGEEGEVLGEAEGRDLVGLEYDHPFCDRIGRVVEADYVTLEDGTGLVHTAPGHGHEDYETGVREGVEVYSPVGPDGTYDESVPDWLQGLSVWDANDRIVERLKETGHLLHAESYRHSYPHDWRSKTPVIFRCTEQWFVAVDRRARASGASLREMALRATEEEIRFIPVWGAKRLRGMLEARPDWCISRQRAWGLPIPAFRRPDGTVFLSAASVRAVAGAFARAGSDAWFSRDVEFLLADYDPKEDPDAPSDLDVGSLTRMYDIFDVWFESGSSWNAVLRGRDLGFPADLYLEGSDQHRGWFQLSLLPSLGVTGRPPFKNLLTHGFMVDKEGRKMSKSLGNALEVEDLLKDFGADVCRWWVSSLAFESDIKVDKEYFELAGESYRKVRNTLRFMLSNLSDFSPGDGVDLAALSPTSLDLFALERAAELGRKVMAAYDAYEFRQAHLLLFDFCNDTLSSLYLDSAKDRLYCDPPGSARRRATQTVLFELCESLSTLLAPILPHTADEAYRTLYGDAACVHVESFVVPEAEADPGWPRVLEARDRVLKALEEAKRQGIENPLDAGVVLGDEEGSLVPFEAELPDLFGVSRVELVARRTPVEVVDLRDQPRCERSWRRDETVKQRSDGGWLSDRDAEAVESTVGWKE